MSEGIKIPLLVDTGMLITVIVLATLVYARVGQLEKADAELKAQLAIKVDYYTQELAERDLKLRDQEIATLKETLRRIERRVDPSSGWRPRDPVTP